MKFEISPANPELVNKNFNSKGIIVKIYDAVELLRIMTICMAVWGTIKISIVKENNYDI